MAEELIEMGWYLGINGIVTFKNAEDLRQVVLHTPLERLLLETDSPYLAPAPHRGKRCEPAFTLYTAQVLSKARSEQLEEFCAHTEATVRRFFKIDV